MLKHQPTKVRTEATAEHIDDKDTQKERVINSIVSNLNQGYHVEDFSKKLLSDFPEFFKAQRDVIECSAGWYGLVYTLMQKLKRVAYRDGKQVFSFEVDQVKEKFGELRFYVSCDLKSPDYVGCRERVYALISEAEAFSSWVCEHCGSTMNVTNEGPGWIKTLCAKCRTPTAP